MGFNIQINCTLEICPDTGKHFYYNRFEKIYDMPQVIPEQYRKYVSMKGKHFRIYTNLITDDIVTSVENFVDKYPKWSDIVEDPDYNEDSKIWNEDKHDQFYDALKWFSKQNICYMISWF